jgi:hypothetical protein
MILGLISLASFLACSLALVVLVITGGPIVWIAALVAATWIGTHVWHWLQQTTPVDVKALLPADHR